MDREESLFDQAVKRLDRAISQVEQKLASGTSAVPGSDAERERLAQELAEARAREKSSNWPAPRPPQPSPRPSRKSTPPLNPRARTPDGPGHGHG